MHRSLAEHAQTVLNGAIQREIVAGAVVAASDGKSSIVITGGSAPNDPSAPFVASYAPRIGCLLKPLVATIVHQLEEEGALKLDDPVHRYLGQLEFQPASSRPVSLLHLLSHTSGVTDHALETAAARRGRDALSMIRELGPVHVYGVPGEFVSYSTLGYLVLEAIIERVCDRGFLEVLSDRIFAPLQIARTDVGSDHCALSVLDLGLRMTCTEMSRFVSEFANRGAGDRSAAPRLLRVGTVEKLLRIKASLPGFSQLYDSWSAGWARFGAETFGHNAISPDHGARIVARFSSKTARTIVIVARTRRVFPLLGDVCHAMLRVETPKLQSIGALRECAIDADFEGVYWLQGGRFLQLRQDGGTLRGSLSAEPESEGQRVTLKTTTKSLLYVGGADGKPLGLFSFVRSGTGNVFVWDGQTLHPRVRFGRLCPSSSTTTGR